LFQEVAKGLDHEKGLNSRAQPALSPALRYLTDDWKHDREVEASLWQ
jgi:hypothetical protein